MEEGEDIAHVSNAVYGSVSLLQSKVSAAYAARYGVAIQAEAVIDGGHSVILILEAADRSRVEAFMGFLAAWGEIRVLSASSTDEVVARGGCGMTHQARVTEEWEDKSTEPILSSAAKQGHACNLRKTMATCLSVSIVGNTAGLCNLQFTGTGLMPGAPVNFEPPNMPSGSQQVLGANGPMTVPSTGVLNVASNGWNPAATDPAYVFTVQAANGTTLTSGPLTITC